MTAGNPAPGECIVAALRGAARRGQVGLVAYLTAGFPRREQFREHLSAIAAAADVVEIGVPFTDPMADGITIQRASEQALRAGVSLPWILDELASLPPQPTPVLLMSYFNPLLAYGLPRLAAAAARAGICGFIVPDVPFEESEPLRAAFAPQALALVQMVTPVTPSERMARIARASLGFIYAVTTTGITGAGRTNGAGGAAGRAAWQAPQIADYLARVRAAAAVPVCAGFGIRSREQVEALRGMCDGVIIGSALVEALERGESPAQYLATLR